MKGINAGIKQKNHMNMALMFYMFINSVFFLNVNYDKPKQFQNVTESN